MPDLLTIPQLIDLSRKQDDERRKRWAEQDARINRKLAEQHKEHTQ